MSKAVVTGVWLRQGPITTGARWEVLLKVDGVWRRVLTAARDDPGTTDVGYIVDTAGILNAPLDDLPPAVPVPFPG